MAFHEGADTTDGQLPRSGDPFNLEVGGLGTDVGIEAASRGRHQVNGDRILVRGLSASDLSMIFLRRSGFLGPRFDPPVASAL